jgi:hypothetical protein
MNALFLQNAKQQLGGGGGERGLYLAFGLMAITNEPLWLDI